MFDVKRALVVILGVAVIGGLGLGYCALAFKNGVDLFKDGGLMALISGLTLAASKLFGGNSQS